MVDVMRKIWAMISHKDNIWVQLITKNYLKNKNIWRLSPLDECSWCWRKLLRELESASKIALYAIGDGRNTSLWYDPWHPSRILIDRFQSHFTYDSIVDKKACVSNIIQNGIWKIPEGVTLFVDDTNSLIENVDIHNNGPDELEDSARNRQFMSKVNVPVKYFHKKILKCFWTRPVDGEYMINSDRSLSGSSKGVSIPYHELQGIKMGMQGAINRCIRRVCLGTDSALAILYIKGLTKPPWEARWILKDILNLISQFDQFRMIHIFRDSNKAADHLTGLYPGLGFLIV
ncbi:hypothetical protein GIB67_043078 [Kingdonia uniflora]|uniref:RNase H type-1 domain-containing protein n=1 Tax=Kingdonia uniflora TaxID=39325 RepID=A0A7J7M9V1_9MAGN|nr:hypothetical protein GIB67_043078 [Kingdonia uniflora]